MIAHEEFHLELTGAEASNQNGIVESPNHTYTKMIQFLLYSSDLGQKYCSFAIRAADYVKNRLPHRSIRTTP